MLVIISSWLAILNERTAMLRRAIIQGRFEATCYNMNTKIYIDYIL